MGDSLEQILARKKIRDQAKVVPQDDGGELSPVESALQPLLGVGDYIRYGMSPEDKLSRLVNDPEYKKAKDQADLTEAQRKQSARLGVSNDTATKMGFPGAGLIAPMVPTALTGIRETAQGIGSVLKGGPFFTPGGLDAKEQTYDDASMSSGFNLRSLKSAAEGSIEGSPIAQILKMVLGK